MDDEFRQLVIDTLRRGEALPVEWARELFPPEKREYELVYHGKEREEDILAETMAVPLQPVRTFGKSDRDSEIAEWRNMLIFGDNLQAMKSLLKMKEQGQLVNADGTSGVRLIYIDPPFGTGDEYGHRDVEAAYSAKVQGARFIEFLRERLVLMRELLSENGSIYVRLDYHFGHYMKVIMDEVFGYGNFQNEIVINRFKRQLAGLKRYNVATDSLFFYAKSNSPEFKEQTRARLCSFCGQTVPPAWRPMSSPELRHPPERVIQGRKLLPPRGRHWTFIQVKIDQMEAEGRIRINEEVGYVDLNGDRVKGLPEYLQTEDTPVDSNWTDLKGYVFGARYPTENPEELLERVIRVSSDEGDLVLDAFAGSGTTCAVAEKLGRHWIGIDVGKLAIYTIQKRMLNLKSQIGNKGKPLKPKPFTLYNAGLYDFATLRQLPREDWRFFALQLFGCKDEPHTISGFKLDGKLKGASVLVFNHHESPDQRIDEDTVQSIHAAMGKRVGRRFFIIAPRFVFDFQQDYIDLDGVRYYALRIPYSVINELHHRKFTALRQPNDETDVNDIVEAWGFDFIRLPEVTWSAGIKKRKGQMLDEAFLQIKKFKSHARLRGEDTHGGIETFSMLMFDFDYNGDVFDLDAAYYAHQLEAADWTAWFSGENLGEQSMAIFLDIHGNESREIIPCDKFGVSSSRAKASKKARS